MGDPRQGRGAASSSLTIDHNLIDRSGSTLGSSYAHGNPQFLDPGRGDFHLVAGAPAIGKGTVDAAPSSDFDGAGHQGPTGDLAAFRYDP